MSHLPLSAAYLPYLIWCTVNFTSGSIGLPSAFIALDMLNEARIEAAAINICVKSMICLQDMLWRTYGILGYTHSWTKSSILQSLISALSWDHNTYRLPNPNAYFSGSREGLLPSWERYLSGLNFSGLWYRSRSFDIDLVHVKVVLRSAGFDQYSNIFDTPCIWYHGCTRGNEVSFILHVFSRRVREREG